MTRSLRPAVALSLALVALASAEEPAMAVEEPRYTVVESHDGWEVRLYAPLVVAETVVSGEFGPSGNDAFRRLAGYIFGGNDGGRKIAMTAPVSQERRDEKGTRIPMTAPVGQERRGEGWVVSFTMPSEHTLESLPAPDDPRVTLRRVAARRVAAVRFSGTWSVEKFEQYEGWLSARLAGKGLTASGPPVRARFDPPWTPWFLRRNEVQIPLEEASAPAAR